LIEQHEDDRKGDRLTLGQEAQEIPLAATGENPRAIDSRSIAAERMQVSTLPRAKT
jgi:hypothetical protein